MKFEKTYEFAGIPVFLSTDYECLSDFLSGYESEKEPSFSVIVDEKSLVNEEKRSGKAPLKILASNALYREFSEKAAAYDVVLFHSSAIALDGKGYLFAAPSGTGKSTHTRLWRQVFGDRVVTVNDDKPLLRAENGLVTVYGTPWNGKHHLSQNIAVPVTGICFLNRGTENRISPLPPRDALPSLMSQTYRPQNPLMLSNVIRTLSEVEKTVSLWHLSCNISPDAAIVAATAMSENPAIATN